MAAAFDESPADSLNEAERAFLAGVFTAQGVEGTPTADEVRRGLQILSDYALQVQDTPPDKHLNSASQPLVFRLSDSEWLMLAAVAYLRFGVTKPESWQWAAAHRELFGPMLRPVRGA